MAIKEVFPNPTVKQVIFQIRFPNLFFIETKIGDFQLRVMELFPESAMLTRRQIVFADVGPGSQLKDLGGGEEAKAGEKIWQFSTAKKDVTLNIQSSALDIVSTHHKTYNLGERDKFRDVIAFVLEKFFALVAIPRITRIGLRYIDECPVPEKKSETFASYYNSVFPLSRFKLEDSTEMSFRSVVRRGEHYIRYVESLREVDGKPNFELDFDGFALNVKSEDCLSVLDQLHVLISTEYEATIKGPVYEHMRRGRGVLP